MSNQSPISDDTLILWRCNITAWAATESAYRFLDRQETERADAFVREPDRRRFAVSRWLLKKLLGSYLGTQGSQLRFLKNTYGKPYLNVAGAPSFNLSHSGDICVIGIAARGAIGVDVELHREIADIHDLAEMVLSADERSELRALPDSAAATAGFLRGWTRKEAVIKALGLGIGIDLQAVTVGLQPAGREVGPVPGISTLRLRVQSFERAPGEYIAVAHDSAVRRVEVRTPDLAEIEAL